MPDAQRWLRRIYISEAISNIGSRLTAIALSYQLYRQTGRGADLGWYYLMLTLPGVIFSNSFGRLADRYGKKWLLVYADGTRAAILLVMAFLVPPGAAFWLFPLVFLSQVFRTLYDVAVTPLVSDLSQDEAFLVRSTANLKMIFNASFVLGLGLGGFVAAYLEPHYVFLIDAATFVFSAALIRTIPIAGSRTPGYGEVLLAMFHWRDCARWFHLVWEGFQIVRRQEYRKAIIILEFLRDFGYGVLNPLLSLWPQALFGGIPNSLGISLGMRGGGSILGGLFASRYISQRLSNRQFFFRLCVALVLAELAAMAISFTSNRFVVYIFGSLAASFFMNAFEVSAFARYVATAQQHEKGALTGFFRFTMQLTLTLGMGVYILIVDRMAVRFVPLLTLAVLATSTVMLIVLRRPFQSDQA